jgi:hypothetical protein
MRTFKKIKYCQLITLLLGILLINTLCNKSYSQSFTEYEVKAAYIYNFAKFVEWPDSIFPTKSSPIILGIYNGDPFGDILTKTFEGRSVNGRKWIIKYFKEPDKIEKCNILFIPKLEMIELLKVLNAVKNKSVLTVGDNVKDFCQTGGMLNFTPQNSKNRFEINNNEALKAKLIISSKLLILSKIIRTNEIKF